MTGQAIADVLPCMTKIFSMLSVSKPEQSAGQDVEQKSPKSAFIYFMTSVGISLMALLAFLVMIWRHDEGRFIGGIDCAEADERLERKVVGLWRLFKKLKWLAMAVAVCFAITMVYSVFTQQITSVHHLNNRQDEISRLFQPAYFIFFAFLLWNTGDLAGRLCTLVSALSATRRPRLLLLLASLRAAFIPLYLLCNLRSREAIVPSDAFYLFVVQFGFGLSNGYVGSEWMMAAADWVEEHEREAAGGFMSLMLVKRFECGQFIEVFFFGGPMYTKHIWFDLIGCEGMGWKAVWSLSKVERERECEWYEPNPRAILFFLLFLRISSICFLQYKALWNLAAPRCQSFFFLSPLLYYVYQSMILRTYLFYSIPTNSST